MERDNSNGWIVARFVALLTGLSKVIRRIKSLMVMTTAIIQMVGRHGGIEGSKLCAHDAVDATHNQSHIIVPKAGNCIGSKAANGPPRQLNIFIRAGCLI